MAFVSDILLLAGALGASLYCHVLSRRLRRFTDLEKGVGGAVAVLSAQVDDLSKALRSARETAAQAVENLSEINANAEASARKLQLLIASTHDTQSTASKAEEKPNQPAENPFFVRRSATDERTQ